MEVIDSVAKVTDSRYGVDALPYKVRGVKVCSENWAYCISELHKCFGVIYAEAGVHLECDLCYAMSLCKCCCLLPVRNENLVPLIVKNAEEVIGPGASYPVGCLILSASTGTAGECDDSIYADLLCKENCVYKVLMEGLSDRLIGMNCVTVACKSCKLDIVLLKCINEFRKSLLVCKKLLGVAMSLSGESAGSDLYSLNAESLKLCESFIKCEICIKVCKYTKFHNYYFAFFINKVKPVYPRAHGL